MAFSKKAVSHGYCLPGLVLLGLLASCSQGGLTPAATNTPKVTEQFILSATPGRTEATPSLTIYPTVNSIVSPSPTVSILDWQSMPVVPEAVSQRTREIYQLGGEFNNKPNVFSVIGDCLSTPTYFLTNFDSGSQYYNLGEYVELQSVIDEFQGSFSRKSIAVGRGFNAGSVLSPLWADPNLCHASESPLACELRLNRPAFAFILLGTNDANHQENFEGNMRQILDYLIEQGVVPVLATKADNLEGDQHINSIIVRLALEYDIPLWNYWLAIQPLPNHGLKEDGIHLTWAVKNYDFSNALAMENDAWPWRNLTFLQVLASLWRAL